MKIRTRIIGGGVVTLACLGGGLGLAGSGYGKPERPEEIVLVGTIVDLQSYMTEEFTSDDPVKSTRAAIRAGVPAALETDEGLVVIGMGNKNPARKLVPLAYREVELTGRLYDEEGFEYIDMSAVRPIDGEDTERTPDRRGGEESGEDEAQEASGADQDDEE